MEGVGRSRAQGEACALCRWEVLGLRPRKSQWEERCRMVCPRGSSESRGRRAGAYAG